MLIPVLPAFAPVLAGALQGWPRSPWIATAVALPAVMSLLGVWLTIYPEQNQYFDLSVHDGATKTIMAEFTDGCERPTHGNAMFDWSRVPF